MVQLIDSDIRTREVLSWRGLHIFHARMSSCSQKLRIFLNLKDIAWEGHEMNLAESETYTEWFMGINPRGLVPVLVRDGEIHIESNDILAMLDERFPEPRLFPPEHADEIAALLRREDDIHHDLRTLSFRFVLGRTKTNKPPELLSRYRDFEATVGGAPDIDRREHELHFYERLASEGLSDAAVRAAADVFRDVFDDLERRLSAGAWFLGETLSVLDIAWFVYAYRLTLAGYPFARLHPRVHAWYERLAADDRFVKEVTPPPALRETIDRNQAEWAQAGKTFCDVTGY